MQPQQADEVYVMREGRATAVLAGEIQQLSDHWSWHTSRLYIDTPLYTHNAGSRRSLNSPISHASRP
jgi:hypothetical protein